MSSETITYIVAPVVSALIGGAAWLVKHYFEQAEEMQKRKDEERAAEQKRVFVERNEARQKMQDDIADLQKEVKQTKKEVKMLQVKIMTCKHDDCPNKALLAEELEREV